MPFKTPKKPLESRPELNRLIKTVARNKGMDPEKLIDFLLPFFTVVDLKLIYEELIALRA